MASVPVHTSDILNLILSSHEVAGRKAHPDNCPVSTHVYVHVHTHTKYI